MTSRETVSEIDQPEPLRHERLAAKVVEISQKPAQWLRQRRLSKVERAVDKLYKAATGFVVAHGLEAAPAHEKRDVVAKPVGVAFIFNGTVAGPIESDPYEEHAVLTVSHKRRKWFRRRQASDVSIEVAPHLAEVGFINQEGDQVKEIHSGRRTARLCKRASRLLVAATTEHKAALAQEYPLPHMPVLIEVATEQLRPTVSAVEPVVLERV